MGDKPLKNIVKEGSQKIMVKIIFVFNFNNRVVIISFSIVCIYMIIYDVLTYFKDSKNCLLVFRNEILNTTVWFLSRSFPYFLWTIPVLVVFFPSLKRSEKKP